MFYHSSAGYLRSKCMTGLIEGEDSLRPARGEGGGVSMKAREGEEIRQGIIPGPDIKPDRF